MKIRIIAMILAALMITAILASCREGGGGKETGTTDTAAVTEPA